jgi:hypothetical protein
MYKYTQIIVGVNIDDESKNIETRKNKNTHTLIFNIF